MYKGPLAEGCFAGGGPKCIALPRFADSRGSLAVLFEEGRLPAGNNELRWVLELLVHSGRKGTVRGLHFQQPPGAQSMLIHVLTGRIWDVLVDVRKGSPTFGEARSVELSADDDRMLFVPEGFAHGYATLVPDTRVLYKLSREYRPDLEAGIAWSDTELNIPWPLEGRKPVLSDKDALLPPLMELETGFLFSEATAS